MSEYPDDNAPKIETKPNKKVAPKLNPNINTSECLDNMDIPDDRPLKNKKNVFIEYPESSNQTDSGHHM